MNFAFTHREIWKLVKTCGRELLGQGKSSYPAMNARQYLQEQTLSKPRMPLLHDEPTLAFYYYR